jgi:hypothetical protein
MTSRQPLPNHVLEKRLDNAAALLDMAKDVVRRAASPDWLAGPNPVDAAMEALLSVLWDETTISQTIYAYRTRRGDFDESEETS